MTGPAPPTAAPPPDPAPKPPPARPSVDWAKVTDGTLRAAGAVWGAVVCGVKVLLAALPQATLGVLMLCVSLILIVSGLQALHEDLATPLHKTGNPAFAWMGGFQETRRLTGAHLLAVVMFVLTSVALELMVFYAGDARPASVWTMIGYSAGGLLAVADLVCFWMGLRWSGSVGGSPLAATVLSAVYLAMMVLIALLSNMLIAKLFRRNEP